MLNFRYIITVEDYWN